MDERYIQHLAREVSMLKNAVVEVSEAVQQTEETLDKHLESHNHTQRAIAEQLATIANRLGA